MNINDTFYYSQIIGPAEFNSIMVDQHVYIADADDYIIDTVVKNAMSPVPEIVELGCGPGKIIARMHKTLPHARFAGVDIDKDFLDYTKGLINDPKVQIIRCDIEYYKHDAPVDVFVSQGVHHHIAKGEKTHRYLVNIFGQLKSGGCLILSDEFLPDYTSVSDREIKTVIWHSHVIADALRNEYSFLAQEEAKTLLDDIYEGRSEPSLKTMAQIEYTLSRVEEIDRLNRSGALEEAQTKARSFLTDLESLHCLEAVGDNRVEISRQDFKICCAEFLKEIMDTGFVVESRKEIGDLEKIGGFAIWVLRKP